MALRVLLIPQFGGLCHGPAAPGGIVASACDVPSLRGFSPNHRKPARIERRHMVIASRLDVRPEERDHLDDDFTLLPLRAEDFSR